MAQRKLKRRGKNTSKRTSIEMERDRLAIAEYELQGLSDPKIANILNARSSVPYTISSSTVARDRNINIKRLQEQTLIPTSESINRQLLRIGLIEREAWDAWQRSKQPLLEVREIQKIREWIEEADDEKIAHSKMILDTIDTLKKDQVGELRFLDILGKMIDRRAKLEGQYTERVQMQINKKEDTTVNVKMFHYVNPFMWDDPNVQVIDGEIVKNGKVMELESGESDGPRSG
jgi:hypothetical protein